MSVIDCYDHELIGIYGDEKAIWPIYRIFDETRQPEDFNAKPGDIIIGGGGGERDALVIDMDKAIKHYLAKDIDEFLLNHDYYKHFWSINEIYHNGKIFVRLGWDENELMDRWLADQIIPWLLATFPEYEVNIYTAQRFITGFPSNSQLIVSKYCELPSNDDLKYHGRNNGQQMK